MPLHLSVRSACSQYDQSHGKRSKGNKFEGYGVTAVKGFSPVPRSRGPTLSETGTGAVEGNVERDWLSTAILKRPVY